MREKPRLSHALFTGLSARLLVLTVVFIMVAEFLIWAPSVSRYRKVYLEGQIADAHLAALALEATPDQMVSVTLEEQLLFHAGSYSVSIDNPDRRTLMLSSDMPPKVDMIVRLEDDMFIHWMLGAFETMAQEKNRVLRVIGPSPKMPGVLVEAVMDETPMRMAMIDYSTRILQLSIMISLIAAGLIYVSLQWLMVRPIHRITASMTTFRKNPEDLTRIILPGARADEIGIAERELSSMQKDLHAALKQKSRLAALGAAVAKVNHDLRNSLATAELAMSRLASIDDPEVKEVMPRLIGAIDRAVGICTQTLDYASEGAGKLDLSLFHLQELVLEASAALRERKEDAVLSVENNVPFEVDIAADRLQLFRVFLNLFLNAAEAGAKTVRVSSHLNTSLNRIEIDVVDDGSGFSGAAREKLFQPFASSARKGGSGLGLVIVREIMRAHGGDVDLIETGSGVTTLRLVLPVRSSARA